MFSLASLKEAMKIVFEITYTYSVRTFNSAPSECSFKNWKLTVPGLGPIVFLWIVPARSVKILLVDICAIFVLLFSPLEGTSRCDDRPERLKGIA